MSNISIGIPVPASLFKFEKHPNLGNWDSRNGWVNRNKLLAIIPKDPSLVLSILVEKLTTYL